MAQVEYFERKQAEWKAAGSPPCAHERIVREYYLGTQTGDVGSETCGETWIRGQQPHRNQTNPE